MAEKLVPASVLLLCIETPDQSTHTAIYLLCMFGQSASQSSTLQHASTLRSYKAYRNRIGASRIYSFRQWNGL